MIRAIELELGFFALPVGGYCEPNSRQRQNKCDRSPRPRPLNDSPGLLSFAFLGVGFALLRFLSFRERLTPPGLRLCNLP